MLVDGHEAIRVFAGQGRRVGEGEFLARLHLVEGSHIGIAAEHLHHVYRRERCAIDGLRRSLEGERCLLDTASSGYGIQVGGRRGRVDRSQCLDGEIAHAEQAAVVVFALGVNTQVGGLVGRALGNEANALCVFNAAVNLLLRLNLLRHCAGCGLLARIDGETLGGRDIADGEEIKLVEPFGIELERWRDEPIVRVVALLAKGDAGCAVVIVPSMAIVVGIQHGEGGPGTFLAEILRVGRHDSRAQHDGRSRIGFARSLCIARRNGIGVCAVLADGHEFGAGGGRAIVNLHVARVARDEVRHGLAVHVAPVLAFGGRPGECDAAVVALRQLGVANHRHVVAHPVILNGNGAAAVRIADIHLDIVGALGERGGHSDGAACLAGACGRLLAVNAQAIGERAAESRAAKGGAGRSEADVAAERAVGEICRQVADASGGRGGGKGRGGEKARELVAARHLGELFARAIASIDLVEEHGIVRAVGRSGPIEFAAGIVERGRLFVLDVLAR